MRRPGVSSGRSESSSGARTPWTTDRAHGAAPHELVALEQALAAAEPRRKRAEARRRQRAAAKTSTNADAAA
ncbi:hypothetical protein EOT10_26815 [Streptomyces antnestii]|uniref:Uncharacterized protein n=1 Tax=Streptomyces antnestii TaxID=2494256 RepID=A0A3S2YWH0_9ACTN|nr:hypothetical protein [Streptomyces sp. San01]RVU20940.1 hypothetical protein EOT10_26815 [Streptomyces sp. San01]